MLPDAIGAIIPPAVGVALSPIPVVAVILVLATPRARSTGLAFSAGWMTGLVLVSALVLLLAGGADSSGGTRTAVDVARLVFGVIFLVMAAGQWRKRPRAGQQPETPSWMASLDSLTAGRAAGIGALLSGVNPKNLALTAAAASSIAQVGLDTGLSAIAVGVFVVLGSVTVVGPVIVFLVAPEAARGPLAAAKTFMADYNAVIMIVVLVVLGANLIGDGISGLSD